MDLPDGKTMTDSIEACKKRREELKSFMQNSPESKICYPFTQIDKNKENNDVIQKLKQQNEVYYRDGELAKKELKEYKADTNKELR